MRRIILVTVLILALIQTVFAADPSFRGFYWGDSIDKVKAGEKSEFKKDDYYAEGKMYRLFYSTEIESYKCNLIYFFDTDKKLISGTYSFQDSVSGVAEYLWMVDKLKNLLTEKYGKPINFEQKMMSTDITWKTQDTIIKLTYYNTKDGFLNSMYIDYKGISQISSGL